MARRELPEKIETTSPSQRQVRGPLGPSSPEVTVYASFNEGQIDATPVEMSSRSRPVTILVTDDPTTAARFPNKRIIEVGERCPRLAMLEASFLVRELPLEERTIAAAGSAFLLKAALDDAWKVVAACDLEAAIPFPIAEWRVSRSKGSETATLTRD